MESHKSSTIRKKEMLIYGNKKQNKLRNKTENENFKKNIISERKTK